MRILAGAIFLLLAAMPTYGQSKDTPDCRLQELAIDAALGMPEAQLVLGIEFHRGVNIPQDFGKAATMWRLASDAGVVAAHNNLGYLTYYGKGVKQDHAEGLRLWRLAAEKGFAESQVHIAYAYSDGRYLKQDHVETYAWAKTGKHSAARMDDAQLSKEVTAMAEKALEGARRRLSASQLADAEKKAAAYIARYGSQ